MSVDCILIWRGQAFPVSIERGDLVQTLSDHVAELLNVDFTNSKQIWHGKILKNDLSLAAQIGDEHLSGGPVSIALVASTADEAAALADASKQAPRLRNDLGSSRDAGPGDGGAQPQSSRVLRPRTFGFGSIEVLDLPHKDRAEVILRTLAEDRRVLAVMEARKWFVPVLREMYPAGNVGVDPVCVLGLNVNNGARIELRIRTDDFQGFRKLPIVMKTMFHELAHNAISEHTGEFYGLVSELERQGEAADWTRGRGRVLGGSALPVHPFGPHRPSHSSGRDGGGVIGAVSGSAEAGTQCVGHKHEDEEHTRSTIPSPEPMPRQPPPAGMSVRTQGEDSDLPPELAAAQAATVARRERVEEGMRILRSDCSAAGVDYTCALRLLGSVLQRACDSTRPRDGLSEAEVARVRAVRPSNSQFLRGTAGSRGACAVLQAAGFRPEVRDGVEWLALPRAGATDAGALWLAREVLDSAVG